VVLVAAVLLVAFVSSVNNSLTTARSILTPDIYKKIMPAAGDMRRLMISRIQALIAGTSSTPPCLIS